MFEIGRATAAGAVRQAVFERAVVGPDRRERLDALGCQRRAPEIGVHQHACGVDDRCDARCAQLFEARTDARDDRIRVGNGLRGSERLQMSSHGMYDDRCRQAGVSERLQDLVD